MSFGFKRLRRYGTMQKERRKGLGGLNIRRKSGKLNKEQ
jgi:hypothetical protein